MFETLTFTKCSPEYESYRERVREFIADAMPRLSAASRVRSWMGFDRDFSRRLGDAGLIGLSLPKIYGGQGLDAMAKFVVSEELLAVGAPVSAHWIAERQSAPLILEIGTEEQRNMLIPAIVRGELCFCIGMSEPNAGSDLASINSRARRTPGGGWRVDGQKIWTTNGQHADYMVALVRTSGSAADRHRGLSQILIPMDAPGITVNPIMDRQGDAHFATVFFDGVELPESALLGTEGDGWAQVTKELSFERSGPERVFSSIVLLDEWTRHLQACGRMTGSARTMVGRLTAEFATLRALSIAVTSQLAHGNRVSTEAALMKDAGTAFEQSIPSIVADDLASHPDEIPSPDLYRALVYVTEMAPTYSLRGGTREVLRGIIARELGLR